ncbi:MAG TPA: EamA family transporter [Magnetospirillum sp.]|nr:EamA family transporter [Magnetospirillum sp.]
MSRGIACALLSAALFGAGAPLAKLLLGRLDPWLLAGLLYLGSGIGLALLRPFLPRQGGALARADWKWLAAAVAAGGVIGPVLMMVGLAHSPAASAALALNLEGVFTLALAWVVFRENVDRRILVGAGAILAGAALLSWQDQASGGGWGLLAIAGACLAWAVDNNLTRKLSAGDAVHIAMVKGLAAGAVNTALALAAGQTLPSPAVVGMAALLGLVAYGLSLVLFVLALRHLGTARTGAYFSSAPFVGAVLAVPLLGETPTPTLAAAGLLMAIGIYLHLTESHAHDHVHETLEHEHPHRHDEHHQHAHDRIAAAEPHSHRHVHQRLVHRHPHYPDIHHRHVH